MWRSIASRSSFTRNLGRKFITAQNQLPSLSSSSQVFHHKCFSSSSLSYCLHLLHRPNQPNFNHKNRRFLSHSSSSISEFESESHDPGSSSEELEGENQSLDVNPSQVFNFTPDFDRNDENSGAQMSGFTSIDELTTAFDENGENNGTHMGEVGSVDQELVEGVSEEGSVESVDIEKLESVLSLLQSTVDGSFECSLDVLQLKLNEEFMVRVMETPFVPGEHLIRFFSWASSKEEYAITTSAVLGSLARVICDESKRKNAYTLWDLVKVIDEKESGIVNVEMLNQLISAFSKIGKGKAAFEVFGKLQELGCVPNADTYYLTLEALCKRSFYDWAGLVCQKMLDARMLPDSKKVEDIISFFCKGLRSKEAHFVYLAAKQEKKYPSQRAVNFLVRCLSKVDESVPLAQQMLGDFSGEVRQQSINPFYWVIHGLCRKKDIEGAKQLLLEMIEKGPPPGNAVFNTIINTLSKSGDMEDAKDMLKLMESRGLYPDVFSYSVIISGYVKVGLMEEACKLLADARKKHNKFCPATFHTLIRGYCKLEQFDKAVKLLGDMKKYGVEPNVDEYNKLIQSLCLKALDWKTAEKLLEEMTSNGLRLPGISRGLLSAVKELEQESLECKQPIASA